MKTDKKNKSMSNMMEMCANMTKDECQEMMRKMMSNEPDYRSMQVNLNNEIIGTSELQALFFEWCSQIREELLEYKKLNANINIDDISRQFKLSKESCEFLLNKITN